jgi:hypothetical protein
MGKSAKRNLTVEEKAAIREARARLGAKDTPVTTHNGDGYESPWEPVYRAWCVWINSPGAEPKGEPTNWNRVLPGRVSIGQILDLALAIIRGQA